MTKRTKEEIQPSEVGTFIMETRKSLGINQADLSYLAGITQSEISRIEKGYRLKPHPKYLRKIGEVLRIPVQRLMVMAGYMETEEDNVFDETTPDELLVQALAALDFTPDEMKDIVKYVELRKLEKQLSLHHVSNIKAQAQSLKDDRIAAQAERLRNLHT